VYNVERYITRTLLHLKRISLDKLLEDRYEKLRNIGVNCARAIETAPQPKTDKQIEIPERLSIETPLRQKQMEKI
jgi:hypothetical protein